MNTGERAHAGHGAHGGMTANDGPWWSPSWWDALLLAALVVVLAVYLFLAWRSRRHAGGPDGRVVFAFSLGLSFTLAGVSSPFVILREGSHLGYMLQLELLMSLAPPLLLIGLAPLAGRLSRLRSPPALALGFWLLVIYLWHLPSLHMMGMMGSHSGLIYPAQLASYLIAGLLFWRPLIRGAEMAPLGKLGYLAAAQVGVGLLAAILIFYPQVIYAHGAITQPFGLSALADQKISGAVMMVVDMLVASTVAGWVVLRALANPSWRESLPQLRSPRFRTWAMVGVPLGVVLAGSALILGSAPAAQPSGDATADDTPVKVTLVPADGFGASGTATFTDVDGGVEVGLEVRGLPEPGATYLAHIHPGACADDPNGAHDHHHDHGHGIGEIEHPLTPLVPELGGSARSTTTIEGVTLADPFSEEEFHVNVHAEATGSAELPDTLACGELRATGGGR